MGALTLRIGDDHGLAALHHCHAGIGRAEIDADYFAHTVCFLSGAVPVSYTHLDVYKRQGRQGRCLPQEPFRRPAAAYCHCCLLYTSRCV